jgi:transcriptional regulator GlxA family with amidase domain
MEELDAVGPWEVFGMAGKFREGIRVVSIGATAKPVRCTLGLELTPMHTIEDHPPLDVLLLPGGFGTRPLLSDARLLDWIARTAETATWTTSVCTGAFLLVAAGPARDKRVATHWAAIEELKAVGPCTVVEGTRFVRDGKVVTSAGVSAGIDMALWVLGQVTDPGYARQVQRFMQYDPAPPYTAEV